MRKKNSVLTCVMAVLFLGFFLLGLGMKNQEYSFTERRKLKEFPTVTWNAVLSGRFMNQFEDYVLDHIPFRDQFRAVKVWTETEILGKENYHDIYVENGYAAALVYPMNEESMNNAVSVMESVYDAFLKETDAKVYFSMIPDKNYFLAKESGQLSMDYEEFEDRMVESAPFLEYIPIMELLSIEDYYRTDSHWRQECITDLAKKLGQEMGAELSGQYEQIILETPFRGVYSGEWLLPLEEDEIVCLTNPVVEHLQVYDYENNQEIPVYDYEKEHGNDMYEIFLGGSVSLVTIENPNADKEKELMLFRDSFGSSIAPLLAEGYSKVTLVDLRYLRWERLNQFIDFTDQDVLFLYSTSMLNHNELK